jgi:hypothetical protein
VAKRNEDPIDVLIPPPLPWWGRFLAGSIIVAVVIVGSVAWRTGRLYPNPGCCGATGTGRANMWLANNRTSVNVEVYFVNHSSVPIEVSSATVSLTGTRVLGVKAIVSRANEIKGPVALPVIIESNRGDAKFVITFVPETCGAIRGSIGESWGEVLLRIRHAHGWLTGMTRNYKLPVRLPDNVHHVSLSSDQVTLDTAQDPLQAACILLGRTS